VFRLRPYLLELNRRVRGKLPVTERQNLNSEWIPWRETRVGAFGLSDGFFRHVGVSEDGRRSELSFVAVLALRQQRGQAPLPDLFFSLTCPLSNDSIERTSQEEGLAPADRSGKQSNKESICQRKRLT